MPVMEFYSCETKGPKRKQFTFVTAIGDLRLFAFSSEIESDTDGRRIYASLFAEVEPGRLVQARFSNHQIERAKQVVSSLQTWKDSIRASLLIAVTNGLVLPGDAVDFGFTQTEIDASHASYEQRAERERGERAKRELERQQAELERQAKYIGESRNSILSNSPVNGDTLVDVARSLSINVHPRTVGMLRKRVVCVNCDVGRITGKGSIQSAFSLYRQCQKILLDSVETQAIVE